MAKIILSGVQEAIEVADEKARVIERDIASGRLPEFITIGENTIRSSAIKAVMFAQDTRGFEYDLSNPEHKAIIKEFEKDILAVGGFDSYCELQGFIRNNGTDVVVNGNFIKTYEDAKSKMKALEWLNDRRVFAKQQEHLSEVSLAGGVCECREFCKPMTLKEYCLQSEKLPRKKNNFEPIKSVIDEIPF